MTGDRELVERMIKAFKNIGCFIYERDLEERVRDIVSKTGLGRLVSIDYVEPRYPHIRIVAPNTRECGTRCLNEAEKLIAEGRVVRDLAGAFMIEYTAQCIRECEREKIKKILAVLTTYLERAGP